jgi:glucose-1-phosphate cytidylyltransferase
MKVVLFCGGLGLRLRETADSVPKPLVTLGEMPVLWHVMKYYAHFGHKDFILCLGHQGHLIKQYFLGYTETTANDFVMSEGGRRIDLLSSDMLDWTITFVDTGVHASVGERLLAIRDYVRDEEEFLANYSDGLTDLQLPKLIGHFHRKRGVAGFVSVRPNLTFSFVTARNGGIVTDLRDVSAARLRINGGYYVFRQDIFDYLNSGEELVHEPFARLIKKGLLVSYRYDGFWAAMDTFKDRTVLEDLLAGGAAPWQVWRTNEDERPTLRPRSRGPAA